MIGTLEACQVSAGKLHRSYPHDRRTISSKVRKSLQVQTSACHGDSVSAGFSVLLYSYYIQGRRQPTQKKKTPKKNSLHKQFAQTLSLLFLRICKEKGDNSYKLLQACLHKLCFYSGGCPLHDLWSLCSADGCSELLL